jgi:hypothetical protein
MGFRLFSPVRKRYELYRAKKTYFANVFEYLRTVKKKYYIKEPKGQQKSEANVRLDKQMRAGIAAYHLADELRTIRQKAEQGGDLEELLNKAEDKMARIIDDEKQY